MAEARYEYGTNPRKVSPEVSYKKARKKLEQKERIKVVDNKPRQEVKLSKGQRKRQFNLTIVACLAFAVLLAIGYQNSQINVKFNEMQQQKKELHFF